MKNGRYEWRKKSSEEEEKEKKIKRSLVTFGSWWCKVEDKILSLKNWDEPFWSLRLDLLINDLKNGFGEYLKVKWTVVCYMLYKEKLWKQSNKWYNSCVYLLLFYE